jgi:hypothetical protein
MRRLSKDEQEEVLRKLPSLADTLESELAVSVPLGRPHFELWPLLGAARCLRLLRGMLALRDAGMTDVLGVLARALYETWIAAMYVSHGGQEAVDELAADFIHHFANLTSDLRIELPENSPSVLKRAEPKRLSTYELARKLEGCLPQNHPLKRYALPAYKHLFAGESLFSSHGRVGALLQHQEAAEEAIAIKLGGRETPDQLDRLWEAAVLTSLLTIDALVSVGKNANHLVKLVDEIGLPAYPERQNRRTAPDAPD